MTPVLKKVLRDHVMLHSFQMTKIVIISQVLRRGKGSCGLKEWASISEAQAFSECEPSMVLSEGEGRSPGGKILIQKNLLK